MKCPFSSCFSKCCRLSAIPVLILLGILLLALAPITSTICSSIAGLFEKQPPVTETKVFLPLAPRTPEGGWPQAGIFGTYDRAALQRGFQVYKQVCSNCHSMKLLTYRNLTDLGFTMPEVKAIAASYTVTDGPNDQGEMFQRPALPSDHFVSPFPNDQAAKAANGGALPPDLSLIVKAREGHESYVYSILTGFGQTPPADEKIAGNLNYNPYFPGHQIAMPQPLHGDDVTYADGTKATIDQEAKDVAQFLTWASEPKMEVRKQTGIKVLIFLVVFAVVMYRVKRRIWKKQRQ